MLAISSIAQAQKVTPAHVVQVTLDVQAELSQMHQANFSKAKLDKAAPALTPRRPRHVIQKAQEVMIKVQTLRWINNLPSNPVPPIPSRAITPGDVLKLTKAILKDVRELRAKFGIVNAPKATPMPGKKSPTDAYRELFKVSSQLDGLGIPGTVPNDVQLVAVTIINEINNVRQKVGLTKKIAEKAGAKGKSPSDAYAMGWTVLSNLKAITANPKYKIPGGVVMPNRRTSKISPAAVVDLMNNILAEVGAIRVKVGITTPIKMAPTQSGKTPSYIYDAMDTTNVLVASLK